MPKKGFRLNAKNLFLTFSNNNTDTRYFFNNCKDHFGNNLKELIVAREDHKDGTPHLHAYIGLKKKVDYSSPNCLDKLSDNTLPPKNEGANPNHGSYENARNIPAIIAYVTKDGDYLEEGINSKEYLEKRASRKTGKWDKVVKVLHDHEGKSLEEIVKLKPDMEGFIANNYQKIDYYKNIKQTEKLLSKPFDYGYPEIPNHPRDEDRPVERIRRWINENIGVDRPHKRKQLWIWSKSPNKGKTTIIRDMEKQGLRVWYAPTMGNNFYDGYDDRYDLVVFDEFKKGYHQTEFNAFVEGSSVRLNVKGSSVMKTRNVPVIVLSNYPIQRIYPKFKTTKARFHAICIDKSNFIDLYGLKRIPEEFEEYSDELSCCSSCGCCSEASTDEDDESDLVELFNLDNKGDKPDLLEKLEFKTKQNVLKDKSLKKNLIIDRYLIKDTCPDEKEPVLFCATPKTKKNKKKQSAIQEIINM